MSQSGIVTSCLLSSWPEYVTLEVAVAKCHRARVETSIDWDQGITKILVSCAIAPLYENVEGRSREKEILKFSLMSLLGAKPINIGKNVVSIMQQK